MGLFAALGIIPTSGGESNRSNKNEVDQEAPGGAERDFGFDSELRRRMQNLPANKSIISMGPNNIESGIEKPGK